MWLLKQLLIGLVRAPFIITRSQIMFFLFSRRPFSLLTLALIGVGLTCTAAAGASSQFKLSEKRVRIVQREVAGFVKEKGLEGYSDAEVYDYLTTAISAAGVKCRLRPSRPLITIDACKENAQERAEKDVAKKYPPLDMEKVTARAEEAYPLLKAGDQVTFTFIPNPARKATITGKFDEYDGMNLVVDAHNYPRQSVIFTTPQATDSMTLLDPVLNQKKKDEFIAKEKQNLLYNQSRLRDSKRRQYLQEEIEKAIAENEANGHVFYQKKWHSLKDVVKSEFGKRKVIWLKEKERRDAIAKKKAALEAAKAEEERQRKLAETVGQEGLPGEEKPEGFGFDQDNKGETVEEKTPDTKPGKGSIFDTKR